jgi:transcriptional regulator with XRE-family HTH domain
MFVRDEPLSRDCFLGSTSMPRRSTPDPLARLIGRRIRHLREEANLTLEKLAYESELRSKGFLSDIERGLARPTVQTLSVIADHLGVDLLDMVTFPERGDRQRLVDRTRFMTRGAVRRLLRETEPQKK